MRDRNTLCTRPWLSRATSRIVFKLSIGPPLGGTLVRSTTITPLNGALATGVRKIPLLFWPQPPGTAAPAIRRTRQEKPARVNRDRIGTLHQRPAPTEYRRFPSIRKGLQGAFRPRLGEPGDVLVRPVTSLTY